MRNSKILTSNSKGIRETGEGGLSTNAQGFEHAVVFARSHLILSRWTSRRRDTASFSNFEDLVVDFWRSLSLLESVCCNASTADVFALSSSLS